MKNIKKCALCGEKPMFDSIDYDFFTSYYFFICSCGLCSRPIGLDSDSFDKAWKAAGTIWNELNERIENNKQK